MHYKKRKIHKLHGIPIGLCNKVNLNRLYLVSYSIPLSCMVVLLLGLGIITNPYTEKTTHAVETGNESGSSNISFSIGGAGRDEMVETAVETVAYRSHTVTIDISNAEDYYLMISGQPDLTNTLSDSTILAGIANNGVTRKDIPTGQWGYGWDYTGSTANEDMTYVAIPSSNTKIERPDLMNGGINFTGKLNFAANFPRNSVLGTYGSSATLTLVVTPKTNTGIHYWRDAAGAVTAYEAGTNTMQGIASVDHGVDGGFCRDNDKIGEGWTVDLQDARGMYPTTYTIVKLNNNCWMAENLRLSGPLALTSSDSDTINDWSLPGDTVEWDVSNSSNNIAQIKTGSADLNDWKQGYGNYYSWCTATAGTCVESSSAITNKDALSSICPRGWRLPASTGSSSYQSLVDIYEGSYQYNQVFNGVDGINGRRFGYNNPHTTSPYYWTNLWVAAGGIYDKTGTILNPSFGDYWTRRAFSDVTKAYNLELGSNMTAPQYTYNRSYGLSIRCVADPVGEWYNNDAGNGFINTGLHSMQEITRENFTQKYCSRSKDKLVAVGATIKLYDSRDNKLYNIVKLPDGRCWMQENLDISGQRLLTSADSDVSYDWTLPADTTTWQGGDAYNKAVQLKTNLGQGGLYSWSAATASTGSDIIGADQNASGSICPKGWKLPTGGASGQFYNLFGEDGANLGDELSNEEKYAAIIEPPYAFPASGYIYSNGFQNSSVSGHYWSRTSSSSSDAYLFNFSRYSVNSGIKAQRRQFGYSVRCLAEPAS